MSVDSTADALAEILAVDPEDVMIERSLGRISLSHAQASRLVAKVHALQGVLRAYGEYLDTDILDPLAEAVGHANEVMR